jgi:hypothetical protein
VRTNKQASKQTNTRNAREGMNNGTRTTTETEERKQKKKRERRPQEASRRNEYKKQFCVSL